MNQQAQWGFHEATVVRIEEHDNVVCFELEEVHFGNQLRNAMVKVLGVTSIQIDGVDRQPNEHLAKATDGEILSLHISENILHVLIEWNDFAHKISFTRAYTISGSDIKVLES